MDFSNLLKKEIDLKRKKAKSGLSAKRKRLTENGSTKLNSLEKSDESKHDALERQIDPSSTETNEKSSENETRVQEGLDDKAEGGATEISSPPLTHSVDHNAQSLKTAKYNEYLEREKEVDIIIQSEDILNQNTEQLSLQIRKFMKEMLYTWTDHCNEQFPSGVLLETKRDLVKVLYKLRSNKLDAEVVISLATIVHYIQTEQFIRASEAYLKLSIGNVAWPIGVRDVGIHARAADAKIAGDDKQKLANIMKSESTRRWLVAVKRLINYSESLHKSK